MRRHTAAFVLLTGPALLLLAAPPRPDKGATGPKPLEKIAFGSCLRQTREAPVLDSVVSFRPDLFVFLGDNVYADTEDTEEMREAYARLAAIPGFSALRRACPVLATWDDHDYGANDAGAEYPMKARSKEVFLDFWGEPKDSPRRRRPGVYDAKVFGPPGKRVQVILLDTRYNRSALKKRRLYDRSEGPYEPNPDPDATILGPEQWAWLKERLLEPAELRLLCSSIQVVGDDHDREKWGNFPAERDRLFRLLRETRAEGVVVLSGDIHISELSAIDAHLGYTLYDLTSSGLTEAAYNLRPLHANRNRIGSAVRGNNFGAVQVRWADGDAKVSLELRDETRGLALERQLSLKDLRRGAVTVPSAAPPPPAAGS